MRTKQENQEALLEEQRTSGLTIRAFCERKGIAVERFKWWQRALRRRQLEESAGRFLPVVVAKPQDDHVSCRITVGGLVSIECHGSTAPEALELALKTAVRICGRT
jgi:hypothetical protein